MKKTTSKWAPVLAGMLASCMTSKKSTHGNSDTTSDMAEASGNQPSTPVVPSFYTLKEGVKVSYEAPLPNKTEIMVNWTYSDGGKKTQEGFRGWDFDHDGRFEMLEVLDPSGKPTMWAYDFNADGVIDLVQKSVSNHNIPDRSSESGDAAKTANTDSGLAH